MSIRVLLPHLVLTAALALPLQMGSAQTKGIWSTPAELGDKPMSGPAWEAVWHGANQDTRTPGVSNQMNPTNVRVLAAAIVYARTGDLAYKKRVTDAVNRLVQQGRPRGTTLAWARRTGAYVLAADLVGYRTPEFETWLRSIAEVWTGTDRRTLRSMFRRRPNNWGSHAFGALAAIYCYLGDRKALTAIRQYWMQGVTGPNPGYKYGKDLSWHADRHHPLWINPKGATKHTTLIDGLFPDDMRRGGPFHTPPRYTNYAWEVQQGLVMAARVLERVGMPIWDVGDKALYRAAYALHVRLGGQWKAQGDDLWMLAFYDDAYGTNWSHGQNVWGAGKNAGWAYVLENN